ncbi:MAG: hypothetical protein Q9213_001754 [Squamulea squamosa]
MTLLKGIISTLSTAGFVYFSSAIPAPPPKNSHEILQQATNVSHLESLANHAHFTIEVHPRDDERFNLLSMLMNAVDALTAIGLTDPKIRSQAIHFHAPSSPHVFINVNPKQPATDVLNEVATLCIFYGVAHLVKHHQYTEAIFNYFWDNAQVADVIIRRSASIETSEVVSTIKAIDPPIDGLQPHFFYIQDAHNLNTARAFITVMDAIKTFSSPNSAEVLPSSMYTDPGPGWDASILFPTLNVQYVDSHRS